MDNQQSYGISISGMLGVAFVVLKLMGYISWSWWWVLAPFWVPAAIVITILGFMALVIILTVFTKDRR
jgi:hypothetical protein